MTEQARRLRELFASGEHFIAADCYSAVTARVVEKTGFKAAYLGGHAASAFHYAIPDNGIYSQVEQIELASRIAAVIDIPLVVDADTLGETIADAFHFVRRYERAGVAGIHVEDEVNPKHSSLVNGLLPIDAMQERLEACVKARTDLVIIARCDELYPVEYGGGGSGSVEKAIERGRAYIEAGADALMYPVSTSEATAELVAALPGRILTMGPTEPGTICNLSTGWGWSGAVQTHIERCRTLFEAGELSVDIGFDDKAELIQEDLYNALIGDWARKTGRPTR
jgi:2-methylisocitrate lyase-like PEP mutase family enzyme